MTPESDADVAFEITLTLLRVINKIQQGRRTTRNYGSGPPMTMLEADMCLLISRQPGVTGAELSSELGVTRSATSQVIAKLKDKGFVTESHDATDAKRKQLYVSVLGEEAAEIARSYSVRMGKELSGSSREELESARRFVTKLEAFHEEARKKWGLPSE